MKRSSPPGRRRGVSQVEVLVTVGIVAGALGLGLPAMQESLQSAALSSASHELVADLELARAEAVKRNQRVALCKSPAGAQCVAQGGWEQGWIVFHDANTNGRKDAGEELIARHPELARGLRARGNQPVANYVSYTAIGASKSTAGGFQAGTLTLCRASGLPTPSRQVIVNALGRPRVQRVQVASCS
jgi:type IV fimbrial biogenesis protein FimT